MLLVIRNKKTGLEKVIKYDDYSKNDIDKIIKFYYDLGWKITLKY
jgi:hypothetical protein